MYGTGLPIPFAARRQPNRQIFGIQQNFCQYIKLNAGAEPLSIFLICLDMVNTVSRSSLAQNV